jgi:RNA polymerase sigma-70 factor (ECF subfamily)
MSDNPLTALRRLFVLGYDDLKARLTQRLGSADLAGDAMQDTWLRLAGAESVSAVQSPDNYLFRIALNAADDRRRREKRHRSALDIDSVLDVPDERPTPEQALLARSDIAVFQAIVAELPERRRAIFLAARVGRMPRQEIADRLGISRRSVAREIVMAHKHCLARQKEWKA